MGVATRLGALTTLQSAQAGAANGSALDITDAAAVICEVAGTFSDITVNFEASIDGSAWFAVSLATLSSTTRARLAAATATGLYLLENANGLVSLRARTTVGGAPSGTVTVRARSAS